MNQVVILAGGRGNRMGYDYPKVLLEIAGKPIIFRILENVETICETPVVVVGFGSEEIIKKVGKNAEYVYQSEQLGTGHAVSCAKEKLEKREFENTVVLPGDHPLINSKTLESMISSHNKSNATITLAYAEIPEYKGSHNVFYNCGRIIKNEAGEVIGIVELKDASEEQKRIKAVNVSYYCFNSKWLWKNIGTIKNDNSAKEYYLTDLIKIAVEQGVKINDYPLKKPEEGMGVNTPEQLKIIEDILNQPS